MENKEWKKRNVREMQMAYNYYDISEGSFVLDSQR
jgi:hypothetical protein